MQHYSPDTLLEDWCEYQNKQAAIAELRRTQRGIQERIDRLTLESGPATTAEQVRDYYELLPRRTGEDEI